ncbi:MAG: chemotaxis protein CheW [Cyanobacteria bacterium J06649_4]
MSETHLSASASLLQQQVPIEYLAERTQQLATPLSQTAHLETMSVLIFRLGQEWFALRATLCQQVLLPLVAHTLPYRSNQTLLGVVNVRGQMLMKVSLSSVLKLPTRQESALNTQVSSSRSPSNGPTEEKRVYPRMVVVEKATLTSERETWVFDVDELEGIHSVCHDLLESPPVGVTTGSACTQKLFVWQGQRVNLLDDNRLFDALRQQAL